MEELEPLDSTWWINRMLPDGYWLSLDDGGRVQECIRAMAEAERAPLDCGVDKRETPLRKKVLAKVQRIAECRRLISVIQSEIDDAQAAIKEVIAQEESDEDGPTFADWGPEFTVWLVRDGDSWPMLVDAVFVNEADANARAAVRGGNWRAMKYSHIQPPPDPTAVPAPPARPRATTEPD